MEILFVLVLVVAVVVLFVTEWFPLDLVALSIPFVLVLVDSLTPLEIMNAEDALAGFANPALVTIAMMFVLSNGLIRTGAVNFVAERILGISAGNSGRALLVLMVAVAGMSAFINNTPIVVLFVPIALNIARRFEMSPSRLLLPLSYASILGGTCTLIGTSTNLVVDGLAVRHGQAALGMFEFAPLGVILGIVGLAYLTLTNRWLLPSRTTVTSYGEERLKEYVTEVEIGNGSSLVGRRLEETFLGSSKSLRVLEVIRDEEILWPPFGDLVLRERDLLLVKGEVNEILTLDGREGLALLPELRSGELRVSARETTLAELVVGPNSRVIGQKVRDANFRKIWGVHVIAVQRRGVHLRRKVSDLYLRFGDTILVQGGIDALRNLRSSTEFLLLEGVEHVLVRAHKAPLAIGILLAIVALASFRLVDIVTVAGLGAVAMVATGCLSVREAYRAVDLRILVIIAGTLCLGLAMEKTGAAEAVVRTVQGGIEPLGPIGALSGVFLVTMVLTSLITNIAAAALMIPLALSTAGAVGVGDPRAFLFAVAFGASACFATPIGYQTNLFVYGPGGYRFTDFLKVGLPLNLIFWILGTILIPVFWPLHG